MSPVIILGLVLMWACVLVPMWLRRHDEVEESRSVDRFSTAMHTLSRRESRADERYVVVPHRTRSVDVHVSGASAADEAPAPRAARPDRPAARVARPARPARPPHMSLIARLFGAVVILARAGFGLLRRAALGAAAAVAGTIMMLTGRVRGRGRRPLTAAMRRRRTLIGLLVGSVATLALAVVVGSLPLWLLQGMVDVALGAFVWHLSQRGRQAAAVDRQRRRAAAATRIPAPLAEPVRRAAPVAPPVPYVQPEPAVVAATIAEHLVPATPDEAQQLPLTAEAAAGSWEPVPVPPPTYTMKPAAPARPPRTAEYADYSEPLVPPVAEDRDELDDTADLGEILDQRWAVND
jgi:hypothetical protein